MKATMIDDEHLIGLGKLIGNLQSLEFCLRVFLTEAAGEKWDSPQPGDRSVFKNHVTNWDSLGESRKKIQWQIDVC
jgi:hypothetical protein